MEYIIVFKGILLGIILMVPGLSGGGFLIALGLVDEIAAAHNFKQSVIFIGQVFLGVAVGILFVTKAILWVCHAFTLQTYSFFIGIAIGTILLIFRRIHIGKLHLQSMFFAFGTFAVCAYLYYAGSDAVAVLGKYIHDDMTMFYLLGFIPVFSAFVLGAVCVSFILLKCFAVVIKKYELHLSFAMVGLLLAMVVILAYGGVYPNIHSNGGVHKVLADWIIIGGCAVVGIGCVFMSSRHLT